MKTTKLKIYLTGFFNKTLLGAALLAGIFLATMPTASASVIIHDDFTTWTTNGVPTTATATTDNTGMSNNYWTFIDTAYYEATHDRIIASATSSGTGGSISTGTSLSSLTTGIIEVSGKFVLNNTTIVEGGTAVPIAWAAVGFLPDTHNLLTGGLLWAYVNPNGNWQIFANGISTPLLGSNASTKLPAFPASTYTDITLKYDLDASAAALYVDGDNVSGWIDYTFDTSSIVRTGFRTLPNTGSQPRTFTLNEFTVSVVPEPAAAAAVAGLLVVGFALGARRQRARSVHNS